MPRANSQKKITPAKVLPSLDSEAEPTRASSGRNAFLGDLASFTETALRIVAGARWVEAARRESLVRNPDGSESKILHPEGLAEMGRRARSFGRFMADQINAPHGSEFLRLGAESVVAATEMDLATDELPVFSPSLEMSKVLLREHKPSPSARHGDEPRRKSSESVQAVRPFLRGIPTDPTRLRVLVRAGIVLRRDPGHRFLVREVRSWFVNSKEAPSGKTIQRMIKELSLKAASRGAPKGTQQKRRG